ncbi:uncharacterized protein LOC142559976 [Dermacentor variabilis]|uniref:uncharacterized protein LOC142559976 n=1 Tax=Dermacentor variabilis TaxID=34621 RepID=UPI003F5B1ACE
MTHRHRCQSCYLTQVKIFGASNSSCSLEYGCIPRPAHVRFHQCSSIMTHRHRCQSCYLTQVKIFGASNSSCSLEYGFESLVESLELNPSSADIPAVVAHAVKTENASLLTRLDDLEDRSRRDNLIFYGISDTPSETWAQSEKLVCEFLSHHVKFEVPENMVCRAHRLGSYTANKTRPIIMNFSCSKLKDKILALKSNLKSTGVSVGEDFCRATRQSRKKLLDFAKASGQTYSIRLNKLFLNKKCYVYCSTTDNVCEVNMPRAARSSVRSRQAIEGNGST